MSTRIIKLGWVLPGLLLLALLTGSGAPQGPELDEHDARLAQVDDRWLLAGVPFTGTLAGTDADGQRTATGLREGVPDGLVLSWYANGQLASRREYRQGMKDGRQQEWWPDGRPRLDEIVREDAPVGLYRTWYASGQAFEEHRYDTNGHEDGAQKVWYEDGSIRSNYVVRNGRRYGTLGPKGCVGVDKRS